MTTLQIRIDDNLKSASDKLFNSLGMDISTAIRTFLTLSVENKGLPFEVKHKEDYSLNLAIKDTQSRTNLYGPYSNAKDAVSAMLED